MTTTSWLKSSRHAYQTFHEGLAENKLNIDVHEWNKASAVVYSVLYRDGEPMVCLSCGARTNESGALPCGH